MLDRYTTGLLTVEGACARKNLDLSIQSGASPQLKESREVAPVVNLSWTMKKPYVVARRASVLPYSPFIG
jgi:hypothetical protein